MRIDWDAVGRFAGDALNAASEVAAINEVTKIVQSWAALPFETMEGEITQDVFAMSQQQLQMTDRMLRGMIQNCAFQKEEFHRLLSVYAGFHGGWTLRLYITSRG